MAPLASPSGDAACVPLPDKPLRRSARERRLASLPPSFERLQANAPRDAIPRLPERPERYDAYQLPVDPMLRVYAPDPPSAFETQARLGVFLEGEPGSPVTLVDLEGQLGDAEVVLVGELYGVTVVVRQRQEVEGKERSYLVFYGELDRPGPSIVSGAKLGPLAVLGYLPDEEGAALYVEVRREEGAPATSADHLSDLVRRGVSVAVDLRNVFMLRP